jgi:hypothetical protein
MPFGSAGTAFLMRTQAEDASWPWASAHGLSGVNRSHQIGGINLGRAREDRQCDKSNYTSAWSSRGHRQLLRPFVKTS